jgi:succinate dehydrogenase / fumarate reductase membrane anchor subunit
VLFTQGPIGYDTWAGIFAAQWMKALTFSVIVALIWHAWIGMNSIWLDYVKAAGMRLAMQAFTVIWLVSCGGWAIQALWRL